MNWKTTKTLIQQSWIAALIAMIYAIWDFHSSTGAFRGTVFLKTFGSAFFLIMWIIGQYLRVDKQIDDAGKNEKIDQIHAFIVERGMLRSNSEKLKTISPRTVGEIGAAFNKKKSELMALIIEPRDVGKIEETAAEYSRLAEVAAEEKLEELSDIDLNPKKIKIDDLQRLHKALFPVGFEMAGRLRRSSVVISQEGSTTAGPVANAFTPPAPEKVMDPLLELLDSWNDQYEAIRRSSLDQRLDAVAKFHHQFTSIHPFLDGNGRLARIVLSKQIENLLDKKILPKNIPADSRYLAALRAADKKDLSLMTSFIKSLI